MKSIFFALLLAASAAVAEPLAQVEGNGTRIVLYTEPCALLDIINLPQRAEWTAKGKVYAGCWTLNVFSLVVMYFDDKTALTIPVQMFAMVREV